jgi:soluble lytic murein transglycosylase-like protein
MTMRRVLAPAVSCAAMFLATAVAAAEARFPLTVEYNVLRAAIRKQLLAESGGEWELWRTADGCGSFVLRDPAVEPAEGRLRISGPASARAGIPLFGFCMAPVGWDGHAEIVARPEIGPDWQLRLRDLDAQLTDADRQRRGVATRLFSVAKGWAEAELATFTFDLGPPVQDLKTLLGLFAEPATAGPWRAALKTLRPVGVTVEGDAVRVVVAMDVPPPRLATPAPAAPEPALTRAELQRWETALNSWDGFLAFVVKDLGAARAEPAVRDELLQLLLTARHEVLAILARGPEPGTDPVRALFLSTWSRLRDLVRRTGQAVDESRSLRYVVFLAAGDALAALDAAALAAGLTISADGLRRLARTLDPGYTGDPLEYSELPDPKLQQLFRFRDPDAPPRGPRRRPPRSWHWFGPRVAHAADEADEWRALGRRLDRWVPTAAELDEYRDTVERLLTVAAERTLDPDALDARFDDLFFHLVKAVAWQESCWRQFVRREGSVTYLVSRTGDVGMMQINVRIWRGFFNPEKLRWNAPYNVGAGTEILQQFLLRYGVREASPRLENAVRATYSAYNGGPARYRRYRLAGAPPAIRAIDGGFWEKYQAIASGTASVRTLCLPPGTLGS